MTVNSSIRVAPLTPAEGSKVNFGAEISGIDMENLTGKFCDLASLQR
jgi:hypothetical protein